MECASCNRENRPGARFCRGCGQPLSARCPSCGADNESDATFCDACGTSLAAAAPAGTEAARKVVTIVFADLVGSTSLHERLDAESARRVMDRYYEVLHSVIEEHAGTVVKLLGDGVMAAFGVPRVAEDDAIRAVRAGVAMQRAFQELSAEQTGVMERAGLRVAVNTGEVVVSTDNSDVVGDPVNVAARLQEAAREGEVVIGEATQRLVAGRVTLEAVGTLALKGRAESVLAYRVVSLEEPATTSATTFVGRDEEIRRLTTTFEAAVSARSARLTTIVGSAGLGKSRLVGELCRRIEGRATVLASQCDAAGGGTFAPLAAALRAFLGIDDGTTGDALRDSVGTVLTDDEPDRTRIIAGVTALIAGTPALPEETFFVMRRLLGAMARTQPVVLVIDDLQWAEPLLLDLVEHLVQWTSNASLLVLIAARPELRETRSSLTSVGGLVSDVLILAGLDASAATRLAAKVIGAEELPAAIAGRVLATSEGNPLFVAELVRMLVHDGILQREGDRWVTSAELAAFEMPPTIHAVLAARIERLRPEERTVLERAAVVGAQFSRTALKHILPRELHDEVDARLESLRRSELLEPDPGWFLGEPLLRFHHVLIRDAAYRRLLKGTRAELHARFADWVESRAGGAVEHDETIGWHLEQAHQNLRELGPLDPQGRALGERAARYLAAAGRRALGRDDVSLAASLLGRSIERLDADDEARADLTLDWCEALLAAGQVNTASKAVEELGRIGTGSKRLAAWHACFAGQLAVLTDPRSLHATAGTVAAAAAELAAAGDAAGEAKAHWVHALALGRLGRVGACEAALDHALAAARHANDRRRANAVLAGAPLAALWGPSPVTRASGRCLDVVRVLRITQGAPAVESIALLCQAVLEALRGRSEAAHRMIASSKKIVEELGILPRLLEADVFAGRVELLEGDAAAAEQRLRSAYEGLRDHGLRIDAAQAAALLGRALLAQGRAAEAETLSHESEALAGDDLQAAIAWRGVRAEALASRGEHRTAIDFARAAVELAAATDALLDHAGARLALAAALRAAGRRDEANAEEARAIELWKAKGATLLAERARLADPLAAEPLPAGREPSKTVGQRRLLANLATAAADHINTAFAARDGKALADLIADRMQGTDHTVHTNYGRDEQIAMWRAALPATDLAFHLEPLATLGDSLALLRLTVSAKGIAQGKFDVGPYEIENVALIEVDPRARLVRLERFPNDRLGDAIVRLYERYAELLSEGPERERAAATVRSVAVSMGPLDADRIATRIALDSDVIDHRTLGTWSARGPSERLRHIRSLAEMVDDLTVHIDEVLAAGPSVLLVRRTHTGVDRAHGGAVERELLVLDVYGPTGLTTRTELFDADHEDDAFARFDEITSLAAGRPATASPRRRLHPNLATAFLSRFRATVAARDAGAVAALHADDVHVGDHRMRVVLSQKENDAWWELFFDDEDASFELEPIATLGASLLLCRRCWSASASKDATLDVGAFECEALDLVEVDAEPRVVRVETFGEDRLGDGVARLYQRYAELLPDGPERERVTATARSIAALEGSDDDGRRYAAAAAPTIRCVDHRRLGTFSAQGADAFLRGFESWRDVAADLNAHVDDLLRLEPGALLLHFTFTGTGRDSGGLFERSFLLLLGFDADGRWSHWELFDLDNEADALTRFDELTDERRALSPARKVERRVRPNAATRQTAGVNAAVVARDLKALERLIPDGARVTAAGGIVSDAKQMMDWWRLSFRDDLAARFDLEPIASLGASLCLCRRNWSGVGSDDGVFDIGPFERQSLDVVEADAQGRLVQLETYGSHRLADTIVRLYERYAELLPEGPECDRAAWTARSLAMWIVSPDEARMASAMAQDFECVDHRLLGTWSCKGPEAWLLNWHAQLEVSDGTDVRIDDVLALEPEGCLIRSTYHGIFRPSGGAYENVNLLAFAFDADGLVRKFEGFDIDHDAEALARFDELMHEAHTLRARETQTRVQPNRATALVARARSAMIARDIDTLAALHAEDVRVTFHTLGVVLDRQESIAWWGEFLAEPSESFRLQPIASLGSSLVLCRARWSGGVSGDVGAFERDGYDLIEASADDRLARVDAFARDRLADAVVRLYERHAELLPAGPERRRVLAAARSLALLVVGPVDIEGWSAAYAPDSEFTDHRALVGLPPARGRSELLRRIEAWSEPTEECSRSIRDVLALRPSAHLTRTLERGRHRVGGGDYESQYLTLVVVGDDGLVTRTEMFDGDREAEALARFDEVTAEPLAADFENAATRVCGRAVAALAASDWEGFAALFAAGSRVIDRRPLMRIEMSREEYLDSYRPMVEMTPLLSEREVIATRGERLALARYRWRGMDELVGPSDIDYLLVIEADAAGNHETVVIMDPHDLDAAYDELDERFAAGEAARYGAFWAWSRTYNRAFAARDWDGLAAALPSDFVFSDTVGFWPTVHGPAPYVQGVKSLVDLASDTRLRVDHVRIRDGRALVGCTWLGTREGGAFETPEAAVLEFDREGRVHRITQYPFSKLDEARTRFEGLPPGTTDVPPARVAS